LRRGFSIFFAIAVLTTPSASLAQSERAAVIATPHFAFFSDLATNLNDALIAAGRARRAKVQESFHTGPEKACFDTLTAAERAAWARAVDYFAEIVAPFDINAREQILFRIELMAGSDWATGDDRSFIAITRSIRAAAMPAYERCRWPAQDASNRRWIEHVVALLKAHEPALGERFPQVYGTPWARLPYRIDVVDSVSQLGGNAQFFVPAGPHILISSSAPANQSHAALESVFHEASHSLAGPIEEALKQVRARGDAVRGDLSHAVIFYLTGETVRRVLEQAGEPYTPWLSALKLYPDNVRDALAKTLSSYVSGQGTLVQAIDNLVQALSPAGGRKLDLSNDQKP
jgi:hypothetical protein